MMTKRQYIEYLISTPVNYTCANLAEHLEGVSHDAISDYLQRDRLTARQLWAWVKPLLKDAVGEFMCRALREKCSRLARSLTGREHKEGCHVAAPPDDRARSEEHTSEL